MKDPRTDASSRARLAAAVWLVAAIIGTGQLIAYSKTPSARAAAPTTWPSASTLPRPSGRPHLVLFLHPRCPCSRASLTELARILARVTIAPAVTVVMVRPLGAPDAFARTALMDQAASIPGVDVVIDRDGVEAERFGAESSGHAALYDDRGMLMFRGGITAGRGSEGDNVGEDAVVDLIDGGAVLHRVATHVYGCALREEARL